MRLIRQIGSILVKAHAEHTESRLSTALSQASRCTYDSARDLSQKHAFHGTGAALVAARSSAAQESSGPPVSIRVITSNTCVDYIITAFSAFSSVEVCCCVPLLWLCMFIPLYGRECLRASQNGPHLHRLWLQSPFWTAIWGSNH